MGAKDLLQAESHFEFGKNWSDYSRLIDDRAIEEAERGVLNLLTRDEIAGASFLDIGSGSGLHSLAASRLGAKEITAVDIDPDSVETTRQVLAAHHVDATVVRKSVFDMEDIGSFDIVYSWGVLHHTGDMWAAVRAAAEHVKPGGLFVIALYQKTPLCGAWMIEKRIYTAAPRVLRQILKSVYHVGLMARLALVGRNPARYIREYRSARGMSYWHDVHDWLGGYPYESSSPGETSDFVCGLGFEPVRTRPLPSGIGVFGTGCAEYVFRKTL